MVARECYFGHLPIHTKGFRDEQSGGLITRELTSADIEPFAIEQGLGPGWRRIESADELAVKPFMRLRYSDTIPTSAG
jgi:hypothetical protein